MQDNCSIIDSGTQLQIEFRSLQFEQRFPSVNGIFSNMRLSFFKLRLEYFPSNIINSSKVRFLFN
jgi:hypothetical protein